MTTSIQMQEGYITYYKLGNQTDPSLLLPKLKSLGYDNFTPKQRTWLASLRAALSESFGETMVRSLANREKDGYTVIKEIRGQDCNTYSRVCNAKVTESGRVTLTHETNTVVDRQHIQTRTDHFKLMLPAESVSKMMVDILRDQLNGVALRPGGGIYFVPAISISNWKDICYAVSTSSAHGTANNTTSIKMERTDETLRDIRDSIISEVSAASEAIRNELTTNDLGERAITNRINRSTELAKRLRFFEDVLGEPLKATREKLLAVQQASAMATAQQQTNDVYEDIF